MEVRVKRKCGILFGMRLFGLFGMAEITRFLKEKI